MTDTTDDKDDKKPVTLADYIPPEPKAEPSRREPSARDRERLAQIERAVRETEPEAVRRSDGSGRRRGPSRANRPRKSRKTGSGRLVFWAIVIMLVVAFVID
ncbi:DUF3040 domain-containing protein [uncultured Algimonas sp.]|uniref:DUF3040 domain-containing protein n=1 Tax=uncultured Algimonas sp. TaxID=1547920 RepID=UPI0026363703|nr:DUF3040 domain-containing protein [uncultured Algimonas sp.]